MSHKRAIGKQWRPTSDATERLIKVYTGCIKKTVISVKHDNTKKQNIHP